MRSRDRDALVPSRHLPDVSACGGPDRCARRAGAAALRVPAQSQCRGRATRRRMEPGQLRGRAGESALPCHQRQLARVRGRQRGGRAGDRMDHRLDRRAHQYAAQAAGLSHRDHLARNALYSLCDGVAALVRKGRPGQSALPQRYRHHRHSDRRLFHVRDDHGRGLPVVTAGVSPGGRDAAQRQSGVGGSRARERCRHRG